MNHTNAKHLAVIGGVIASVMKVHGASAPQIAAAVAVGFGVYKIAESYQTKK